MESLSSLVKRIIRDGDRDLRARDGQVEGAAGLRGGGGEEEEGVRGLHLLLQKPEAKGWAAEAAEGGVRVGAGRRLRRQ